MNIFLNCFPLNIIVVIILIMMFIGLVVTMVMVECPIHLKAEGILTHLLT